MNPMTRRAFLASTTAAAAFGGPKVAMASSPEIGFEREQVIALARDMAGHGHMPRAQVPKDWRDLSYDQYKSIWFKHTSALWRDTDASYNVDFFHPGLYFPQAITIDSVEDGNSRLIPFDLDDFGRTDKVPDLSEQGNLGYSGFRLRTELSQAGVKNEFCVFQGASYFRAIGIGQTYGLSARGLALKTADPMGEEFPDFTHFWLERPDPGQRNIVVHALLDSPGVTGAYRFDISPGRSSVMEIEATLFPRRDLSHVGLGPLTSMFLFDSTNRHRFDDFRPAVHDSEGLLIRNGAGEVLWRPLANPKTLQVSSFVDDNPTGFGLMQRSRKLSDFNDLEAHYHKRPCIWVEPMGDWGKGAVTLVEIPADLEIYDNIVAYWRPRDVMKAGSRVDLSYRLSWGAEATGVVTTPGLEKLARVTNTSMGKRHLGGRIVAIDFESSDLFDGGPEGIDVRVSSPHAETSEGVLQRNPQTGGLRLAFTFDPGKRDMAEMRAQLRRGGKPLTEVWLYRWTA
ncbi:MAG: glucan biosynthesis protein G [Rhodobacteraceae bacterium]|nr:glucan biosynthesis protein G [Paracoccaceae bacterium]